MRILNDEEMQRVIYSVPVREPGEDYSRLMEATCKAQYQADIKWIVEWGEELDWEHNTTTMESSASGAEVLKRKDCHRCWLSLKQLVEEK